MGDGRRYSATGLGTITFQREHGAPLTLKDVMYVPMLKKKLVSVSMLEDRGYDVIFSKGKTFLRHIATGQVNKIGILVNNIYKLEVEDCVSLSMKAEMKKDKTFIKFCEYKAMVKKESSNKVKALQSGNGGEYVSNEFKNSCAEEGIKRELTTPHNPEQNGVTERKNRSLVGEARVMFHK
eukprot:PITA_25428